MSTPIKQTPVASTPVKSTAPAVDSPGTWRHPRLNEITRRRDRTTFSEKNVRKIAYNVASLLVLWTCQLLARLYLVPKMFPPTFRVYFSWIWAICQIIPVVQITIACLPLVRVKDDLSDIPLTPAQRKLLGLPPVSTPVNPDVKYSTPPRYSRTPSIAGSAGSRGSYNNSPLSGRGSPAINSPLGGGKGSPYSPLDSPLQQKGMGTTALGGSFGASRRSSFGSGSPFAISTSNSLFSDPASPTPMGNKRTSVGLNSKWLYEKGRRSSGSAWVH